jgi:hypothetical protein
VNRASIKNLKNTRWFRLIQIFIVLSATVLFFQPVFANITPEYLKNGRTYDQENTYFKWAGTVGYVQLFHRDGTSLPPSEGGGSCGSGCTENVTRIYNGGSVSGNFTYLQTFSVQLASSGDPGVGTAVIKACGQTIWTVNLYQAGGGTPGFSNIPSPAWNVPVGGDCTWSVSASGGYVDFRAVTTSFRSTPAPTVNIKVNGSDLPFNTSPPANYTLSWTSTNAASCTASGNWSGAQVTNGTQAYSNITSGTYTYTLTCTNPSGSAADSVTINVAANPTVSISAPAALTAPANFTASWSSTNASTCTGSSRFGGLSGLSGSKVEVNLVPGTYDYTVNCMNAAGVPVSDTKHTIVYAAPSVDVKVNGLDGPILSLPGPISYTANWTSTNSTQCSGSERFIGYTGMSGSRIESNIPVGTSYEYKITCQNAAGATVSDSVKVEVVASLSGTISVTYSRLLLFAPNLAQPAQTLTGVVTAGIPPFSILVQVRAPSGILSTLNRIGSTWSVTPENSGDLNFGTTEEGVWTAWADLTDSSGQTYRTPSVVWEVAWHPVHARP